MKAAEMDDKSVDRKAVEMDEKMVATRAERTAAWIAQSPPTI